MLKKIESDNRYFLGLMIMIAVFSLILWRIIGNILNIEGSLNVDDLCSVQFSLGGDNCFETIKEIINQDPTNVPLFYLLLGLWIKMWGVSAATMRLLPQIIGCISIVFIGLIGKKICNARMGCIAAIIFGSSFQLIYASHQIRAYSLLVLFSTIVFYMWLSQNGLWKPAISFIVGMLLLSFSHFFGVLVCAALGSYDLFMVIFWKKEKKCLLPYIIYLCCFIPYLVVSFLNASKMYGSFWPPVPGWRDFFIMLGELCPLGEFAPFLFGCIVSIYGVCLIGYFFGNKNTVRKETIIKEEIIVCIWNVLAVVIVTFLYSKFINPESSLWVKRYLLCVFPFVCVIVAYGLENILQWIKEKSIFNKTILYGCVLFLLCRSVYTNLSYCVEHPGEVTTSGADFEQITTYLMGLDDIYDDTLVYFEYPSVYFEGWKKYASQNSKLDLPELCCFKPDFLNKDLTQYKTIYVINAVYEFDEEEKNKISQTHQLIAQNCDNVYYIDKYIRGK